MERREIAYTVKGFDPAAVVRKADFHQKDGELYDIMDKYDVYNKDRDRRRL